MKILEILRNIIHINGSVIELYRKDETLFIKTLKLFTIILKQFALDEKTKYLFSDKFILIEEFLNMSNKIKDFKFTSEIEEMKFIISRKLAFKINEIKSNL